MSCKHIIHAVGPVYNGNIEENTQLYNAAMNCYKVSERLHLKSIAVPALSSGISGFPKDKCAEILLRSTQDYLDKRESVTIENIRFSIYDSSTLAVFSQKFSAWKERLSSYQIT